MKVCVVMNEKGEIGCVRSYEDAIDELFYVAKEEGSITIKASEKEGRYIIVSSDADNQLIIETYEVVE